MACITMPPSHGNIPIQVTEAPSLCNQSTLGSNPKTSIQQSFFLLRKTQCQLEQKYLVGPRQGLQPRWENC